MPITSTTDIVAVCDNPRCKHGQNGPTVVAYNLDRVSSGQQEAPPRFKEYLTIQPANGAPLVACCKQCAVELLGFVVTKMSEPSGKVIAFPTCSKPLDPGVQEHSPENGPEEA